MEFIKNLETIDTFYRQKSKNRLNGSSYSRRYDVIFSVCLQGGAIEFSPPPLPSYEVYSMGKRKLQSL